MSSSRSGPLLFISIDENLARAYKLQENLGNIIYLGSYASKIKGKRNFRWKASSPTIKSLLRNMSYTIVLSNITND